MIHDPALLDALEQFEGVEWRGTVFRHILGSAPPERANIRGARWNPPGVQALYTSLAAGTAKAEGDHVIALQPVPPRAPRTIYELAVSLNSLLDLTQEGRLTDVGVTEAELSSDDWSACQVVGGAVAWLEHDGLLVPSVRDTPDGVNLVVFPTNQPLEAELEVRGQNPVQPPAR